MSNRNETINACEEQIVFCNGEGTNVEYTEHPKIYLTVKNGQKVVCPYCSKTFVYKFK
ncbi:zinc-finger domain-containing protein [Ehrlichia ruminantium]|uniref:Zinc-finger domain-containing protein n=1 Tax=Ehrlichia ruminantium TaxID=779 RepID=A0AAE6UIV2_EHRRU|nr:zinc-finger domain-containing protein [Ehrlichia ruminantium]QGR02911.1 zinc-finger domain-containing protein [Ehrlichia ruminantium]QGR03835.1 zinc-finger domain-containing protein [Ehrlichia ruminantium]QGR04762.1 zinc-finger domain-containing protein [Ehrlichia ruminantium]